MYVTCFYISDRKTDILRGCENKEELMNAGRDKSAARETHDESNLYKPHTKFIVDEIVRTFNEGRLVYCRFGKQYIINLER